VRPAVLAFTSEIPGHEKILLLTALLTAAACGRTAPATETTHMDSVMNPLAERYVKLVLAVGEHDDGYVDAYYGPEAWREEVRAEQLPLDSAARMYLNGEISADSAARWLNTYALMEPERARQRVRFFDTYRSYVINYNWGRDLVREFVEREGGTANAPERRWAVFSELLSSPRLPSDLAGERAAGE